jgi:transcriptional regulator CtsR
LTFDSNDQTEYNVNIKVKDSQGQNKCAKGGAKVDEYISSMAQRIEKYIRNLLEESNGRLRLQRHELADIFNCVPSQINYVLKTRFTPERGYVVESQRGGGGFIEIQQLTYTHSTEDVMFSTFAFIGEDVSQMQAIHLILNLEDRRIVTKREGAMLRAIIHRNNLNIDLPYRDYIRAQLLKAALAALMKTEES